MTSAEEVARTKAAKEKGTDMHPCVRLADAVTPGLKAFRMKLIQVPPTTERVVVNTTSTMRHLRHGA